MATSGVGSTLDVNSIVSQLMAVEARPLTVLAKKEAAYQAKLSAYGSITGALGSFRSSLAALTAVERFRAITATPADATIFSSTATSKAIPGSYAIDVSQLARAQTVSTDGMASASAAIGAGAKTTLTFEFGTISGGKVTDGRYGTDLTADVPEPSFTQDSNRPTGSVVIDSSNNSLQGIRDAINKAGIGVTASIISDGSDTPHHLVITSDKTGAASSMRISLAGDGVAPPDAALSSLLAYDPAGTQQLRQASAALDTKLSVNGIKISSPTATVSEAIQGVTLSALKVGSTTLKIARDTDQVKSGVESFVKTYNELNKTIKSLSSYDATTKQAGLLLGDSSVRTIGVQVKNLLGSSLPTGNLNNLMGLGITFQKDGTLSVDNAKLDKAIASNFDDIAGLFTSMGNTTDSLVSYTGSTSATMGGTRALTVSALATQGSLAATVAPGSLVIVKDDNDQMAMTVDGVSTLVTLPARTYTIESLAAMLQSSINGASEFASKNVAVTVTSNAGKLTITSNRYGSASTIIAGGNGASNLFGTAVPTDGADAAGTLDGLALIGSGQTLTGAVGSAIEGLKLTVTGGAIGSRGTVSFAHGFAQQLSDLVGEFTDSKGPIAAQTNGLNNSVSALSKQKDAVNLRLAGIEKRYRAQFTALDSMLASMNNTSNYLTQQLAQISNLSSQ